MTTALQDLLKWIREVRSISAAKYDIAASNYCNQVELEINSLMPKDRETHREAITDGINFGEYNSEDEIFRKNFPTHPTNKKD